MSHSQVSSIASEALAKGSVLGPFRVDELLGEGAMGVVYRATRESNGETVALKVLKRGLTRDQIYMQRFRHEAKAAGEVRHNHIVPVLETGEFERRQYLVAAYVSGTSLAQHIRNHSPLPLSEALRIARHIGSGLDALHKRGIVHRDVKPSNILRGDDGCAYLTDFGLAKGRAYTVLTVPGQVMGTMDYMAPELVKGGEGTPLSDIYAFACVIFECLAGIPPFGHKSMIQVGRSHLEETPPDLSQTRDDVSPELSWALLQGLAKEPGERPQTAIACASLISVALKGS